MTNIEKSKKRILLVEDDGIIVTRLTNILQKFGYPSINILAYGEDVLNLVSKKPPDLIILDIHLSGKINGIEVAEQLHARFDIPVIFVTAYSEDKLLQQARLTEPYAYLIKPINERELYATIELAFYRHEIEIKLKKKEEYNRKIIESINDGIIILDIQGNVQSISQQCQKLMEIDDVTPFLNKSWLENWNSIDKQLAFAAINKAREGGVGSFQAHCPTMKGILKFWDATITKIAEVEGNADCLLLVLRDITIRKQVEEKLRKSREDFFNIVGRSDTGILIANKDGIIEFMNAATEKLFKRKSKDLVGQVFGFPIESNNKIELDIFRGDQSIGTGEMSSTITEWNGKMAYLIFIRDITDLKNTENDLRQLTSKLKERNEDLDAYNHMVAHDLRGNLEVMAGFANLLYYDTEKISQNKLKEYSKYIFATSNTLTNVIKELLLFASLPKAEIKTMEIIMKEVVSAVLENTSITIKKSEAEISLPDIWLNPFGYAPWVEEVWKNYISNAIKYGGDPPKIEIGCEQIVSKQNHQLIKYWIKDQGPGISEENQKLLFKKFERLDKAKASGHGLGLSIVRRIIEKLGGTTGVESIVGRGSIFYFTLPAKSNIPADQTIAEDKMGEIRTSVIQKENNIDQRDQTILIVEDIDVSFKFLKLLLESNGNIIIRAKNGEESVELCKENLNIRIVLMDINMPVMDGYEATKRIKKFRPDLPIIAQTAYAVVGEREKSLEAGCDDYITKPIRKEMLYAILEKYLIK